MEKQEITFSEYRRRAIAAFKKFYGTTDKRILKARETRFAVGLSGTDCWVRLAHCGKRYSQHYRLSDLRKED